MSKSKETENGKKSFVADKTEKVKEAITGHTGNTNIREINTLGKQHRIESVITEDGNRVDYKDFHKNISKYTVANLDNKEKPHALIEQGGKIRFKDRDADLVGFAGVKENWNPNIEPMIPS